MTTARIKRIYEAEIVNTVDELTIAVTNVTNRGGGCIKLMPGTYTLTSQIDLPSNTILQGSGRENTSITRSGINVSLVNVDNCSISDLTLSNSGSGATISIVPSSGTHGRHIITDCNITVNGVSVSSLTANIEDILIKNCIIDSSTYGINIFSGANTVDGIIISSCVFDNCTDGLLVNGSAANSSFIFTDNIIKNCTDAIDVASTRVSSDGATISKNVLFDNTTNFNISLTGNDSLKTIKNIAETTATASAITLHSSGINVTAGSHLSEPGTVSLTFDDGDFVGVLSSPVQLRTAVARYDNPGINDAFAADEIFTTTFSGTNAVVSFDPVSIDGYSSEVAIVTQTGNSVNGGDFTLVDLTRESAGQTCHIYIDSGSTLNRVRITPTSFALGARVYLTTDRPELTFVWAGEEWITKERIVPTFDIRRVSTQTVGTSTTSTLVIFDRPYQNDGGFTTSSSQTFNTVSVPVTGWYQCSTRSSWTNFANGTRFIALQINGSSISLFEVRTSQAVSGNISTADQTGGAIYLTPSDTLSVIVRKNSTVSANLNGTVNIPILLTLTYIGK